MYLFWSTECQVYLCRILPGIDYGGTTTKGNNKAFKPLQLEKEIYLSDFGSVNIIVRKFRFNFFFIENSMSVYKTLISDVSSLQEKTTTTV